MRTEQGGVMSIKELEEAGLELPPYHEETWQTGHGPIRVFVQEPASGAGIYRPGTGEIIELPKRNKEGLPKAA